MATVGTARIHPSKVTAAAALIQRVRVAISQSPVPKNLLRVPRISAIQPVDRDVRGRSHIRIRKSR